jgi:hypothetical protein
MTIMGGGEPLGPSEMLFTALTLLRACSTSDKRNAFDALWHLR